MQVQALPELTADQLACVRRALAGAQQVAADMLSHPSMAMRFGHTLAWRNLAAHQQGGAGQQLPEHKQLSLTARLFYSMSEQMTAIIARGLDPTQMAEHGKFEQDKRNLRLRLLGATVALMHAHPGQHLPGVIADSKRYKAAYAAVGCTGVRGQHKVCPQQASLL